MTAVRRVLVVGPSWVGDMVMANALFRDLKRREPAVEIDVLAPPWSLPLLDRMPEVRRGVSLPVAHGEIGLGTRLAIGRALRAHAYDQAIVLPRSAKSALVPFFARVPRRTGYRGELRFGLINDVRPFDPTVLDQTIKRFRTLGLAVPEDPLPALDPPALKTDPVVRDRLVESLGLPANGPVVAMMPGAEYGPAKQWPVAHFRALATALAGDAIPVWVLGSERERPLGDEITRGLPGTANVCGRTSLTDVVDLLSATRVAVSNDSGLMHVAAAVGSHVIGIYGSSSPEFTPPLTSAKTVVWRRLDCSPCFARRCPLGHLDCLRGVEPARIRAAVVAALG